MTTADDHRTTWDSREACAEALVPLVGRLYRENGVVTSVHGRPLFRRGAIDIIKAHRFARRIDDVELEVGDTLPMVEAIAELKPGRASIDVARLHRKYTESGSGDLKAFLAEELKEIAGGSAEAVQRDVVLYGFGRIGRLLARILVDHEGLASGLVLRAIVTRKGKAENDLEKRASLLRRDSVHGSFQGTITVDEENRTITANGTEIAMIYANDPSEIDYTAYGINDAIVIDNTGAWRDVEGLSKHLQSKGVSRVLLTAPGKGNMPNIVQGVNNEMIADEKIVSAASCTTNAITPVLALLDAEYGVVGGHVETVHAFTNDQNLIDNYHKGERRGRSAVLNMVLTETGAAKAVSKALPQLEGKLTGNAIRVPTPDVSMAVLNLTLGKQVTREELNEFLRSASLYGPLHSQIDYVDSPEIVSTDLVGNRHAGIVDGRATIATGDDRVVLYVWYDNEYGYSCQVVRVVEEMAAAHPPAFPKA